MGKINLDFDLISRRVRSDSDRREAFEATTPLLIFRHDWRDGQKTFKDIRAGQIGMLTYDKTPKFELNGTIYGSIPQGARLLRHPKAEDVTDLVAIDTQIHDLQRQRRDLLDAAWWRGEVVSAAEVEGYVAARKNFALRDD